MRKLHLGMTGLRAGRQFERDFSLDAEGVRLDLQVQAVLRDPRQIREEGDPVGVLVDVDRRQQRRLIGPGLVPCT